MTWRAQLHVLALAAAVLLAVFLPQRVGAAGSKAAPEFSLTVQDLRTMTAGLPRTAQDRIIGEPRVFLNLLSQVY